MSEEGIMHTIVNTCALEAVDAIIADLSDRAGIGGEWGGVDEEIKEEIRLAWSHIVANAIRKAAGETWEEALAEAAEKVVSK